MYTLIWDVDNRRGCACVGTGSIWELFVLPVQFFSELKIALKTKVYKK